MGGECGRDGENGVKAERMEVETKRVDVNRNADKAKYVTKSRQGSVGQEEMVVMGRKSMKVKNELIVTSQLLRCPG